MPIKWTADKDQKLLLEIVRASNISVDVKKISENWSTSDNETEAAPTPRAIQERIHKIRAMANKGRKNGAGAGNNNSFKMTSTVGSSSSKSSPAAKKASPAKVTKARARASSPTARRKAAKKGKGRKRRGTEEDSDSDNNFSDTPSTTTAAAAAIKQDSHADADDEDPLLSSPLSSASGAKNVKAEAMDGVVEYDIDWQIVANKLDIPTANAARMRYARLKAQMEGTTATTTANAKATTPRKRKDKPEKASEPTPKHRRVDGSSNKRHVVETDEDHAKPFIKAEPVDSTLDKLPSSTTQNASDSQRQKNYE
ncbi:MAG: hypothetical protein LQ345_003140 [Seirophora villosa]|nr:MAG: hypothetical protein LQ345_003140 [Seirophora villosa]